MNAEMTHEHFHSHSVTHEHAPYDAHEHVFDHSHEHDHANGNETHGDHSHDGMEGEAFNHGSHHEPHNVTAVDDVPPSPDDNPQPSGKARSIFWGV